MHENIEKNINQKTERENDTKYKRNSDKIKKEINREETQYEKQPITVPEIKSSTSIEESIQHEKQSLSIPNKTSTPAPIENNNIVSKPDTANYNNNTSRETSDNNTSERISISPKTSFNSLKNRTLTQSYPGIIEKRSAVNIRQSLRGIQSTQYDDIHPNDYSEQTINIKFDSFFKKRNEFDDPSSFTSSSFFTQSAIDGQSYRGSFRTKKPHWEQDNSRQSCSDCSKDFSFFRRRHHCRNCGKLFCADCCHQKLPIIELNYHTPVLICNACKLNRNITEPTYNRLKTKLN
jgi:hypothetical protein